MERIHPSWERLKRLSLFFDGPMPAESARLASAATGAAAAQGLAQAKARFYDGLFKECREALVEARNRPQAADRLYRLMLFYRREGLTALASRNTAPVSAED